MGALATRMGTVTLVAAIAVWIAWFFMPAMSIDLLVVSRSFTFWDVLGLNAASLANPMAGSHGFFSLIGILAIGAPFAAPFVVHPRAKLLNALPPAYLVLAVLKVRWDIGRAFASAGGSFFGGMAQSALSEMLRSTTIGAGAYVLVVAALFLTAKAVHKGAR